MEWMQTLQGNYGPNMNAFWWVVAEIYTTWETLKKNFDANSTRRKEVRTNERTNERTNIRTDERKNENNIPLGINAGGITKDIHLNSSLNWLSNVNQISPNSRSLQRLSLILARFSLRLSGRRRRRRRRVRLSLIGNGLFNKKFVVLSHILLVNGTNLPVKQ